jgi:hypothetical protein
MKTHILAKIDLDWADEFSCYAFAAMSKETWEALKLSTEKCIEKNGSQEIGFGTNETWDDIGYDDWESNIKVTEITEEDFKSLKHLFGRGYQPYKGIIQFGTGVNFITFVRDRGEDEQ